MVTARLIPDRGRVSTTEDFIPQLTASGTVSDFHSGVVAMTARTEGPLYKRNLATGGEQSSETLFSSLSNEATR